MAPSLLDVPTINWANFVGVKSVQFIKLDHVQKGQTIESINWDLEKTFSETEKEFATDLQLFMTG